MIFRFH
ncbi:hypothetical protein AYI69_g9118, partial [Smittium culicis]